MPETTHFDPLPNLTTYPFFGPILTLIACCIYNPSKNENLENIKHTLGLLCLIIVAISLKKSAIPWFESTDKQIASSQISLFFASKTNLGNKSPQTFQSSIRKDQKNLHMCHHRCHQSQHRKEIFCLHQKVLVQ